jgi:hypothetical protein
VDWGLAHFVSAQPAHWNQSAMNSFGRIAAKKTDHFTQI